MLRVFGGEEGPFINKEFPGPYVNKHFFNAWVMGIF